MAKYRENYPCVYCDRLTPLEIRVPGGLSLGSAAPGAYTHLPVCAEHQAEARREIEEQLADEVGIQRSLRDARQS